MSDINEKDKPDDSDFPLLAPHDELLDALVTTANRVGSFVYVTLFMKGSVICGQVIGGRQFYEKYAEMLEIGCYGEINGKFAAIFKARVDALYPLVAENEENGEEETSGATMALPTFIHLANARVFAPGKPGLPQNGLLWRGRLSEVDGWSLGMLGVSPGGE